MQIQKFLRGFYFCKTLHVQSFVKIKSSHNGEITLSFTDIGKACHSPEFQMSLRNMSFNAIRENKILAKKIRIYSMFSMTRYRSKVLLVAILIPLCDLEIKVTDLDFSYMSDFFFHLCYGYRV